MRFRTFRIPSPDWLRDQKVRLSAREFSRVGQLLRRLARDSRNEGLKAPMSGNCPYSTTLVYSPAAAHNATTQHIKGSCSVSPILQISPRYDTIPFRAVTKSHGGDANLRFTRSILIHKPIVMLGSTTTKSPCEETAVWY